MLGPYISPVFYGLVAIWSLVFSFLWMWQNHPVALGVIFAIAVIWALAVKTYEWWLDKPLTLEERVRLGGKPLTPVEKTQLNALRLKKGRQLIA